MKKLKILFVNGNLNIGGVERSLVNLLNSLDFSRYDVDLLLMQPGQGYENELREPIKVIRRNLDAAQGPFLTALSRNLKSRNWFCVHYRILNLIAPRITRKSFKLLKLGLGIKNNYDIAIAYRPGICADIVTYAVCAPKKICWWHHGNLSVGTSLSDLQRQLERFDVVVAVSDGVKNMLSEACPILSSRLKVIPNIIDREYIEKMAEEYTPYDSDSSETANQKTRIVTVGRLSPEKNASSVIEVAKRLKKSGLSFNWYIVGDGECAASIKKGISDAGLNSDVFMVGNQINPYPWIARADIMVHLSPVESFGIVLIEAMALKVPCIAVESIGANELINERNGLLVENDVNTIADAIYRVTEHKQDISKVIETACRDTSAFSSQTISKSFNALCDAE